jgi:uncharacterized membrane protein (DUF373 family)
MDFDLGCQAEILLGYINMDVWCWVFWIRETLFIEILYNLNEYFFCLINVVFNKLMIIELFEDFISYVSS